MGLYNVPWAHARGYNDIALCEGWEAWGLHNGPRAHARMSRQSPATAEGYNNIALCEGWEQVPFRQGTAAIRALSRCRRYCTYMKISAEQRKKIREKTSRAAHMRLIETAENSELSQAKTQCKALPGHLTWWLATWPITLFLSLADAVRYAFRKRAIERKYHNKRRLVEVQRDHGVPNRSRTCSKLHR